MVEYLRVLKYPLSIWLIGDTVFTIFGYFVPAFATILDGGASILVQALPLGVIVGYKMIQFKGNMFHAMVVGAISGIWCVFLAVTEVGMVLTPFGTYNMLDGLAAAFPSFTASMIGAIVGAGYSLMRKTS